MNALRYTCLQLMLWAFELKLWMDGLPWKEARFLAEKRTKDFSQGY